MPSPSYLVVNSNQKPSSHSSPSLSSLATPAAQSLTRVDGHGFWRSWKRNFQNKLTALLDLIDNSLDAALVGNTKASSSSSSFVGRVHIYPDELLPSLQPNVTATNESSTTPPLRPSGLCIVNNSHRPIRPLKSALEIYSSSKVNSGANDIGENGIGLKQSCATLSELSFVLVTNKTEQFVELGIIAESLQLAEGPFLPDFRFKIAQDAHDVLPYLKKQMTSFFMDATNLNVAKCIAQYGGSTINNDEYLNDMLPSLFWESLEQGVDRLCQQYNVIINNFFNCDYVFAVLLDKLSYGKSSNNASSSAMQQAAMDAIQDLREVIPRTYLHVPTGFDFRIGSTSNMREKTVFHYWPQRLVELSTFAVNINENFPWYYTNYVYESTSYKLRVFVGFDRVRINDPDAGKTASLFIYSCHSGRLIKHEQDARNILGLTSGGSTYSSGLTILVDDIDGKLPLNPTKTDIAFAEQANGDTHKCNLFAWVGAVSCFFYNYHLAKFDNKKKVLTKQIQDYGTAMQHVGIMKDIDMSDFTSFKNCKHKYYGKKSIRFEKGYAKEIVGIDTQFKLVCNTHPVTIKSSVVNNVASKKRERDHDESMGCGGFPNINQNVATVQSLVLNNPQQQYSRYFNTNKGQNQVTHQYQQYVTKRLVDLSHMKNSANLLDFQSTDGDTDAAVNNDDIVIERPARESATNDQFGNQNQADVSIDAAEKNLVVECPAEESFSNDQDSPAASSHDDNGINTSATDTADNNNNDDDNDTVTSTNSTKSTYKDLCKQLTVSLEKKNTRHCEDKKEQKRLEQKVSELEREIERQNLEKGMFVHKVSTLEREIEQQKLVVAGPPLM